MKRRSFLKKVGASGTLVLSASQTQAYSQTNSYQYPKIKSLKDAVSKEGHIVLRIALSASEEGNAAKLRGRISIKGAEVNRTKAYFFDADTSTYDIHQYQFDVKVSQLQPAVMAFWLAEATEETQILLSHSEGAFTFSLQDLIQQAEVSFTVSNATVTSNLLLDKEMDSIKLSEVGGQAEPGENFRFAIMADPQGGDPEEEGNWPTRMKIHNAWIEDSIRRTNELNPQPVFTLILGDIVDSQGQKANFHQMNTFLSKLDSPVLYAVGNHETRYRSVFSPGYNMEAFDNYLTAQKEMNGMNLMLYSFDVGAWHFVVWPDPLRAHFWETHPHYFDWLERDLAANKDRPTFFFQHIPMHPIGIDPLINYAESVSVKRLLLDILSKHVNVKYIFSGHVHIPVKASFKTAVDYKGMKMINLPAAGYRPRAFGEEDFAGGPCQGLAVVEVNGKQADVRFKTVTQEEFRYPTSLPVFDEEKYALWLTSKSQLPAADRLINGDFEQDMLGWTRRFVYTEDKKPSNICEVRPVYERSGFHALYLYNRKRAYDIPGQDRLPQTINRIAQAVRWDAKQQPLLKFDYYVDDKVSDLDGFCGGYLQVEAYDGSFRKAGLLYWLGKAYVALGNKLEKELTDHVHCKLPENPGRWQQAKINPASDLKAQTESNFASLKIDRLVISLGVWTMNDGADYPFGVYFDKLSLDQVNDDTIASRVGKTPVVVKPSDEVWWLGKHTPFTHIAGEHRYIFATKQKKP